MVGWLMILFVYEPRSTQEVILAYMALLIGLLCDVQWFPFHIPMYKVFILVNIVFDKMHDKIESRNRK